MICGTSCFIAIVLLITNIYMIFSCKNTTLKSEFMNVLSEEQKKTYIDIIEERKNIYYTGFGLGILLSILFIFILNLKKIKLNKVSNVCIVGLITFVTNYLYYILIPKKDYMLLHLTDKEQIKRWLDIYKYMQFNYHVGFLIGIMSVCVFSYSFCN